jgi:hypothetical protein
MMSESPFKQCRADLKMHFVMEMSFSASIVFDKLNISDFSAFNIENMNVRDHRHGGSMGKDSDW